jgi:hypothetical protein
MARVWLKPDDAASSVRGVGVLRLVEPGQHWQQLAKDGTISVVAPVYLFVSATFELRRKFTRR